ncbi:MAG TPA: hypothetical protein VEI05_01095 [Burkholderiaceae bacterium]|nr:hypothetical protein [Burkholderiaceae bacterium]
MVNAALDNPAFGPAPGAVALIGASGALLSVRSAPALAAPPKSIEKLGGVLGATKPLAAQDTSAFVGEAAWELPDAEKPGGVIALAPCAPAEAPSLGAVSPWAKFASAEPRALACALATCAALSDASASAPGAAAATVHAASCAAGNAVGFALWTPGASGAAAAPALGACSPTVDVGGADLALVCARTAVLACAICSGAIEPLLGTRPFAPFTALPAGRSARAALAAVRQAVARAKAPSPSAATSLEEDGATPAVALAGASHVALAPEPAVFAVDASPPAAPGAGVAPAALAIALEKLVPPADS